MPRRTRKTIPLGTKLPVHFSTAERDLIRTKTFADPDFGNFALIEGTSILP